MNSLCRCIEYPTWRGTLKLIIIFILIAVIYPTVYDKVKENRLKNESTRDTTDEPVVKIVEVEKENPCPIPALQNFTQFRDAVTTIEMGCQKTKMFGRSSSRRNICLDEKFNINRTNCLAFSFGINYDFSFEDSLGKFGCKVFAYDPTMKRKDHQRSKNVRFIATGISNYDGKKVVGMGKHWVSRKVNRFENLVKEAGMEGKPIDVVKLDVELSEVDFMQDMLFNSRHVLKNIKQIAMEIHSDMNKKDVSQITSHQVFWPYLNLMRCAGFKILFSRSGGRWREVVFGQDKQW
ncbi:uncharacterized protein LOC122265462 [Penaeus japonicus]|uniref:uncharacterized protein LOC122265462 n=1 Tax=Penaeus japonicus TaxID=27405 RepID=UPI001C710D7C|nr:uncharacterized protein LOC122265462 [Penaeus japonicus]